MLRYGYGTVRIRGDTVVRYGTGGLFRPRRTYQSEHLLRTVRYGSGVIRWYGTVRGVYSDPVVRTNPNTYSWTTLPAFAILTNETLGFDLGAKIVEVGSTFKANAGLSRLSVPFLNCHVDAAC